MVPAHPVGPCITSRRLAHGFLKDPGGKGANIRQRVAPPGAIRVWAIGRTRWAMKEG